MTEFVPPEHLLDAVAEVDRALWESGDTMTIGLRNLAAHTALAAGWTLQDVADRVGVLPGDVTRWVSVVGQAAAVRDDSASL
jgi:hypothetical protein